VHHKSVSRSEPPSGTIGQHTFNRIPRFPVVRKIGVNEQVNIAVRIIGGVAQGDEKMLRVDGVGDFKLTRNTFVTRPHSPWNFLYKYMSSRLFTRNRKKTHQQNKYPNV